MPLTITISSHTESLLKAHAARTGESTNHLADTLLGSALLEQTRDFDEACEGIAAGLADGAAGREVTLEAYAAQFEEERRARRQNPPQQIPVPSA